MKVIVSLIALTACFLSTSPAYAAQFSGSGKLVSLSSQDDGLGEDWAAVEGFAAAGTCRNSGGLVVMKMRDSARGSRQFSLLMAALLAGRAVHVTVDDTSKDPQGFCYLRTVRLDN